MSALHHYEQAGAPGDPGATFDTSGGASVSLGGAGDMAASVALAELTPEQRQAYGNISSDVQGYIKQGINLYGTAAPAIDLATKISSGEAISPIAVVGGLAAVATLAAGPVVGGAVGAIGAAVIGFGTAVKAFFVSLGFVDAPKFTFTGLIRKDVDVKPYGPGSPVWIDIQSAYDLSDFLYFGLNQHPALNKEQGWDSVMVGTFQQALLERDGLAAICSYKNGSWQNGHWRGGASGCTGVYVPNDFDHYFAVLMVANLQNWANGLPFLPPRDLLRNSIRAWNTIRAGQCVNTYQCPGAVDPNGPATICYAPENQRAIGVPVGLVSRVLGSRGDWPDYGAEAPPVCVNMGALVPQAKRLFKLRGGGMPSNGDPAKFAGMNKSKAAGGPSLGSIAALGALAFGAVAIFKPAMLAKIGVRIK